MAQEIGLVAKLKPEVDEQAAKKEKRKLDDQFSSVTPQVDAREAHRRGLKGTGQSTTSRAYKKARFQKNAAKRNLPGAAKRGAKFMGSVAKARAMRKVGLPVTTPSTAAPGVGDILDDPRTAGTAASPSGGSAGHGRATGGGAGVNGDAVGILQEQLEVQREILEILDTMDDSPTGDGGGNGLSPRRMRGLNGGGGGGGSMGSMLGGVGMFAALLGGGGLSAAAGNASGGSLPNPADVISGQRGGVSGSVSAGSLISGGLTAADLISGTLPIAELITGTINLANFVEWKPGGGSGGGSGDGKSQPAPTPKPGPVEYGPSYGGEPAPSPSPTPKPGPVEYGPTYGQPTGGSGTGGGNDDLVEKIIGGGAVGGAVAKGISELLGGSRGGGGGMPKGATGSGALGPLLAPFEAIRRTINQNSDMGGGGGGGQYPAAMLTPPGVNPAEGRKKQGQQQQVKLDLGDLNVQVKASQDLGQQIRQQIQSELDRHLNTRFEDMNRAGGRIR